MSYLGNGDGLLLHDLVDGCPVTLVHLVEFINAADSLQHLVFKPVTVTHFQHIGNDEWVSVVLAC